MARRRVRGMVAVVGGVVATLVAGTLAALPASAATDPVITSISVSSTAVTVPGEVVLSYTAETGGSPARSAQAMFMDPGYEQHWVELTAGARGSATLSLPDGVTNGRWQLQYLELVTEEGAAEVCGVTAPTSCRSMRDLSAYDVTVSGSHGDHVAPRLTSVSTVDKGVGPSRAITLRWTAIEDHRVAGVEARWTHALRGTTLAVTSPPGADLSSGQLVVPVPKTADDGDYALSSIDLTDGLGHSASFRQQGQVVMTSEGRTIFSHSASFADAGLTVTGSTTDSTPPVLTSFARTSSPAVGRPVTMTYAVTESRGLRSVEASWLQPQGQTVVARTAGATAGTTGTLSFVTPVRGLYVLQSVTVTDLSGNSVTYRRDGTAFFSVGGYVRPHSLDLTRADAGLPPQMPMASIRSMPQALELRWYVPYGYTEPKPFRVTVNPGGRVVEVDNAQALKGAVVVPGLKNAVQYTVTIAERNGAGLSPARSFSVAPLISGNVFGMNDVDGDRRDDLLAYRPDSDGIARIYRNRGTTFTAGVPIEYMPETKVYPSGRIEGRPAFLRVESSGEMDGHGVSKAGQWRGIVEVAGMGYGGLRFVDSSADLTGDGQADLVTVTRTGSMYLYPRDISQFLPGHRIGTGWQSMAKVFVPGDVTGDRKADVMAIDSAGVLWIYRGNGRGGWLSRVRVGAGWCGMGGVFSARDVTGDGIIDLGAITMDGKLRIYPGRGNGSFRSPTVIGHGWNAFL